MNSSTPYISGRQREPRPCPWLAVDDVVIEAVGNGGGAEGVERVRDDGGEDAPGADEHGLEAVAREAALEPEHRVGEALLARHRPEQHVRAPEAAVALVAGGGGRGGARRGGAPARAPRAAGPLCLGYWLNASVRCVVWCVWW